MIYMFLNKTDSIWGATYVLVSRHWSSIRYYGTREETFSVEKIIMLSAFSTGFVFLSHSVMR